ncbi:MAG: RnfABCDGE type electron transport complex subunit C, partial [Clostridiales bacterium]|nr:RnfABCDGE type electron transport complex subunit C [Clostridiales bacterium]
CGIVGMGGAGFPTAVKLTPSDKIDTLILNGAECEPYLTCDYRLMIEQPDKILEGGALMARALGLESFVIGVEDNKPQAVMSLENAIKEGNFAAKVVVCRTKYPQGAEKQLIYAVTQRKVRVGKLPASAGCIVSNVQTAIAVYKAVKEGVPCYERVVTVTGDGIKQGGNFLVRTGTSYADLIAACQGENYVKMISGGPMMGFAVQDDGISVSKTTGGILLMTEAEAFIDEASPCINCASCARACPMQLMPMYIDAYILKGDAAGAEKYGAMNCIECGCCVYVCPAKRTLLQSIRIAKRKIREKGARA